VSDPFDQSPAYLNEPYDEKKHGPLLPKGGLMTRWVAEIGSNHNGSLERAIALVDAAAAAGFTDVKTQHFRVNRLFAPEALAHNPELRSRERLEVPWEWHKPLANRCKEHGMGYGVTVFHVEDVRRCALEADWLKVSSYSLLDHRLIEAVSWQPKPAVISTGMADEQEVMGAISALARPRGGWWAKDLMLLHCVSSYPAAPHEANLRSIPYMRERFGVPVGWSDHTTSPLVLARAERVHGASMIEVHWDLDDSLGDETVHSWTPSWKRWRPESKMTDDGFYACDGKKGVKAPAVSEHAERDWRADPEDGMRPLKAIRGSLGS
jgi:sialic acid synthase SpsE